MSVHNLKVTNMQEISLREHLAKAGRVKSKKKAKSSAANGKKGGRPKK